MTHAEACEALRDAAELFKAGTIDRDEWFDQVDAILTERELSANGLPRGPLDGGPMLDHASRTSTARDTPPRESSRLAAARLAHAGEPA